MRRTLSADTQSMLGLLRAFCRYQTHGGYTWGAALDDGALLCERCARENYRQVFACTRDKLRTGWQLVGLTHSGEQDDPDIREHCAHCGKHLWGGEPS